MNKPIRLFSESMAFMAEFDTYSSLQFARSWHSTGSFQFVINRNLAKATLIDMNQKIMVGNSLNKLGIITDIQNKVEEEGKASEDIVVIGKELKHLFVRRTVNPLSGQASYTYTGSAETIAKTLVYNQMGAGASSERRFSRLKIATDKGRGSNYTIDEKWTITVDQALMNLCLSSGMGWIVQFSLGDTVTPYEFEMLEGRDKSDSVLWSLELDSIRAGYYYQSDLQFRNVAYVGGAGVGTSRTFRTVGSANDESRYELFVDAQNLSTSADLDRYGAQALSTMNVTRYLKVQPLEISPFVYESDWDLGDIITVSAFDYTMIARVVEVKEIYEPNNYHLEITFDREFPNFYKNVPYKIAQLSRSLNYREQ